MTFRHNKSDQVGLLLGHDAGSSRRTVSLAPRVSGVGGVGGVGQGKGTGADSRSTGEKHANGE